MLERVLGVLDLKRGKAVGAFQGQRHDYQVVSIDGQSIANPICLARFYLRQKVAGLYVADLDAIAGSPVQLIQLGRLIDLGIPIWMDVGFSGPPLAYRWLDRLDRPHVHWVLATETGGGFHQESVMWLREIGSDRLTVSIDMFAGDVRLPNRSDRDVCHAAEFAEAKKKDPVDWVCHFFGLGFRSFLLLDLASVGTQMGPATVSLCRHVRNQFPEIQLISGGGVRNSSDLQCFWDSGVDTVLVASALHRGMIGNVSTAGND